MNERASQNVRILAHLKKATLTPLEALKLYGCFRLGARVYDLKKDGHNIRSRLVETNGKRVAQYVLIH
jgi:helix-turn-helix protein